MWNSHVRSSDEEKTEADFNPHRSDSDVVLHRGKIYLELSPRIDRTTASNIQALIDHLNSQLIREVMPMLEEVLANEPAVLPLT